MKKQSPSRSKVPAELAAEIERLEKLVKHEDENLNHNTIYHTWLDEKKALVDAPPEVEETPEPSQKTDTKGVGKSEEIAKYGS